MVKFGEQIRSVQLANAEYIAPGDYLNYASLKNTLTECWNPDNPRGTSRPFLNELRAEILRVDSLFTRRAKDIQEVVLRVENEAADLVSGRGATEDAPARSEAEVGEEVEFVHSYIRALVLYAVSVIIERNAAQETCREGINKVLKKHDKAVPVPDLRVGRLGGPTVEPSLTSAAFAQPKAGIELLEGFRSGVASRFLVHEMFTSAPPPKQTAPQRRRLVGSIGVSPLPAISAVPEPVFSVPWYNRLCCSKSEAPPSPPPPPTPTPEPKAEPPPVLSSLPPRPFIRKRTDSLSELAKGLDVSLSPHQAAMRKTRPLPPSLLGHGTPLVPRRGQAPACRDHSSSPTASVVLKEDMWAASMRDPTTYRRAMERVLRLRHIATAGVLMCMVAGENPIHSLGSSYPEKRLVGVFVAPLDVELSLSTPSRKLESPLGETPAYTLLEVTLFSQLLLEGDPFVLSLLFQPRSVLMYKAEGWESVCSFRNRFMTRAAARRYLNVGEAQLVTTLKSVPGPNDSLDILDPLPCCASDHVFRALYIALEAWRILTGWSPLLVPGEMEAWPVLLELRKGELAPREGIELAHEWIVKGRTALASLESSELTWTMAGTAAGAAVTCAAVLEARKASLLIHEASRAGIQLEPFVAGAASASSSALAAAVVVGTSVAGSLSRVPLRRAGDSSSLERWLLAMRLGQLGRGGLHVRG